MFTSGLSDLSLIKIKNPPEHQLDRYVLGKPEVYIESIDNRLACKSFNLDNHPDTSDLTCCTPFNCNYHVHTESLGN